MTHLICEHCEAREVIVDDRLLTQQHVIATYYSELRAQVRERHFDVAGILLARAPTLGIKCQDLVAGLLQPLVQGFEALATRPTIESGQVRPFASPIEQLLEQLVCGYPELQGYRASQQPEVLLVCLPGPLAHLTIRLLSIGLASRKMSSLVVSPGEDLKEVGDQLNHFQSSVVVFGAATDAPTERIESWVLEHRRHARFARTQFVIPGTPTAMGHPSEPKGNLVVCRDAMEMLRHIAQLPKAGAALDPNRFAARGTRAAPTRKSLTDR